MGCGKTNEFSCGYDFGFLPESRKMPQISRDQEIGAGSIGTFQEPIVIGVASDLNPACRSHGSAMVLDELEELLPEPLANFQLRAGKNLTVLFQDGTRDIPAGRLLIASKRTVRCSPAGLRAAE